MGRLIAPTPLLAEHLTTNFDCGSDSLNEWIIHRALKNESNGGSRTYVVCDDNHVVAYYAIATGSIERKVVPGRIRRNMPEPIPALVLGRLAVDLCLQGQGFGQGLLKDALARSINVSEQVGARVLIVHAINDKATTFYRKHGFVESKLACNTMLLPLTLRQMESNRVCLNA